MYLLQPGSFPLKIETTKPSLVCRLRGDVYKRQVPNVLPDFLPNPHQGKSGIPEQHHRHFQDVYKRQMQSKFMSVKCLPDGELPEDEKRNLAVRGLLLAATEDKYESINYLLL